MAEKVVIEGTVTPSTFLAAGERRTVSRTEFVDKLIAKGFVKVVDQPTPAVSVAAPAPVADDPVESATDPAAEVVQSEDAAAPPSRNARRATWAKFLDNRGIDYPEEASRDDLVDIYTNHTAAAGE